MSKSNTELLKTQFLQLMVITMEECGELIQECSKSMRRNDENHQPLKDEIGDVYCMIQLCKEYGIDLTPYSPLARGFLTGKRNSSRFKNDDIANKYSTFKSL